MFETPQAFLDFVNENGGPSQLAMLVFNNSYIKLYGDGESFNPTVDFDVEKGLFRFIETDVKRREYITFKSYLYLEGVTFAPVGVNKDTLNYRNFRP